MLGALNENLNSAEAFALIDGASISLDDWKKIDELFGLNLIAETPEITDDIKNIILKREQARAAKNWTDSDKLRDELAEKNIAVKDTSAGSVWEYLG